MSTFGKARPRFADPSRLMSRRLLAAAFAVFISFYACIGIRRPAAAEYALTPGRLHGLDPTTRTAYWTLCVKISHLIDAEEDLRHRR